MSTRESSLIHQSASSCVSWIAFLPCVTEYFSVLGFFGSLLIVITTPSVGWEIMSAPVGSSSCSAKDILLSPV